MSNTNVKKFIMDGADFPIVDEEARADIVDINNSLTQKASKAWTKIGDYSSTTAVSIDLSGYSEVMLILASTPDSLVVASSVYPIDVVTSKTVNVYWYYNNLKYGRISNNGTKAIVGDSSYPMTIYARQLVR